MTRKVSVLDEAKTSLGASTESPRPAPDKPAFPDPKPTVPIQVEATLICDFDRYSNGSLPMTMDGASIASDGEVVGTVAYGLGGSVSVKIGSRTYSVRFADIFAAIYEAESALTGDNQ